ncbi:hypothetical protein X975_20890, partial [Stegodyphus mimosarum]
MDVHVSGILVVSSLFIRLHFSPKAMMIGHIVNFSVDAMVIHVTVAAFYVAMSITVFVAMLLAVVIVDLVAKMIWFGMV